MKTKLLISLFLLVTSFLSFSADNEIVTKVIDGKEIQGRLHPKGGGFVALTAYAGPKVFVGPKAMILDNARVTGSRVSMKDNVIVRDNARVKSNTRLMHDVVIQDNAVVGGGSFIRPTVLKGSLQIQDNAMVKRIRLSGNRIVKSTEEINPFSRFIIDEFGNIFEKRETVTRIIDGKEIYGQLHKNGGGFVALTAYAGPKVFVGPKALILDYARVIGDTQVRDNAVVRDNVIITGNAEISGNRIVKGNERIDGGDFSSRKKSPCQKSFK